MMTVAARSVRGWFLGVLPLPLMMLTSLTLVAQDRDARGFDVAASATDWRTGTRRAVVVGVSEYPLLGSEKQLRFAHTDAAKFAAFLRSPAGGVDSMNIEILLNQRATAPQINGRIKTMLDRSAANDVAIIYYAGHGDVMRLDDSRFAFLLGSDVATIGEYDSGGAIQLQILEARIREAAKRGVRVLLITDACRSGAAGQPVLEGAAVAAGAIAREEGSVTKIVSSQANELSFEGSQWGGGHGVFTFYLLQGLQGYLADGSGAADSTGVVTAFWLRQFVAPKVHLATDGRQNPNSWGDGVKTLAVLTSGGSISSLAISAGDRPGARIAGTPEDLDAVPNPSFRDIAGFRRALLRGDLVSSADSSAWNMYHRLSREDLDIAVLIGVRNDLFAALEENAQDILRTYMQGGNDQPSSQSYQRASNYLGHALQLLADDDPYYNAVLARQLFLDAYVIIRRQERPLYTEAITKLRRSIDLRPDAAYAFNALGLAYLHRNQFDSAEVAVRSAIERAPRWTYPRNLLGILRHEQRRYADALTAYSQVIEMDSSAYYAYNNLGNTYWRLGRYQEAERLYHRSIAADSTRGVAHVNLSNLYRSKKRYRDAAREADHALRLDSLNAEQPFWIWPRLTRGWLYEDLRAVEGSHNESLAVQAFHRAAEQAPFDPRPFYELGRLYRQRKRFPEAEAMYRRAIANDSSHITAYEGLAYLLHERDNLYTLTAQTRSRFAESERLFALALERAAHPSPALLALGEYWIWIAELEGNPEKTRYYTRADSVLRLAVQHDPYLLAAYYKLADLSDTQGALEGATFWYRQAEIIGSQPIVAGVDARSPEPANESGNFWYRLAGTLDTPEQRAAALDSARIAFLRSAAIDPTFPAARNNLGGLYLEQGDHLVAAREFQIVVQLGFNDIVNPKDYAGSLRSGASTLELTQPHAALEIYGAAVALDPENHVALDGLARVLYRVGRAAEAASFSDSSLVLAPPDPSWLQRYLPTAVLIALDMRNLEQAEEWLGRMPAGAGGVRIELMRAMIDWERGRTDAARATLRTAEQMEPRVAESGYLRDALQLSEQAIQRIQRIVNEQPRRTE